MKTGCTGSRRRPGDVWLVPAALALAALAGCDEIVGFRDQVTPLAKVKLRISGDLAPLTPAGAPAPALRVALVWAAPWQPEPFCILPAESEAAAAVIATGCPDSLRFAPTLVAASVEAEPGATSTLELMNLPEAGIMVGDVTARVAYGSLVAYDDRDGDGSLGLRFARHWRPRDDETDGGVGDGGVDPTGLDGGPPGRRDVVYGASFISMALPDQRLAFREGGFNDDAAFYPRKGCPPPPAGFSILSAGGFSLADAQAAVLQGKLPRQDPATCHGASLDQAVVEVRLQDPSAVQQVACIGGGGLGHYHEPPPDEPDLGQLTWACVGLPHLGSDGPAPGIQQLVVGTSSSVCRRVAHYILRGCRNDPACATADWDLTGNPPSWWPCDKAP